MGRVKEELWEPAVDDVVQQYLLRQITYERAIEQLSDLGFDRAAAAEELYYALSTTTGTLV